MAKTSPERLAYIKEWREKNRERVREYQRRHRETEKRRTTSRRYVASEKGRENDARRRARDRDKVRARELLNTAVRDGHVEKGPCEVCGVTDGVEGHHTNYELPYDVRWLCQRHHRDEHRG